MKAAPEDLFEPVLAGREGRIRPPFSAGAHFVVGFFGGPFALLLLCGASSRRMGRFRIHLPLLLAAGVVSAVALVLVVALLTGQAADRAVSGRVRLGFQAYAVLLCGLWYLLNRDAFKAASMDPPSPWIPGILAWVGGILVFAVFVGLGLLLGR